MALFPAHQQHFVICTYLTARYPVHGPLSPTIFNNRGKESGCHIPESAVGPAVPRLSEQGVGVQFLAAELPSVPAEPGRRCRHAEKSSTAAVVDHTGGNSFFIYFTLIHCNLKKKKKHTETHTHLLGLTVIPCY